MPNVLKILIVIISISIMPVLSWLTTSNRNGTTAATTEALVLPAPDADGYEGICESLSPENPDGDIVQQCRMAVAAEKMTWWTMLQVAIGIAGIWLLSLTARYTKNTLRIAEETLIEAKATTTAAYASADMSRELGQKQIKAYLSIRDLSFELSTHKGRVDPKFVLQNSGQSPAKHVDVLVLIQFSFPNPASPECVTLTGYAVGDVAASDSLTPNVPEIIVSGNFVETIPRQDIFSEAIHGRVTVGVYGEDVFGAKIEELYSFVIDSDGAKMSGQTLRFSLLSQTTFSDEGVAILEYARQFRRWRKVQKPPHSPRK